MESLISVKLTADLSHSFEHRGTVYATLTTIECSALKSEGVPPWLIHPARSNLKFHREFRYVFSLPSRVRMASSGIRIEFGQDRNFIKFPIFLSLTITTRARFINVNPCRGFFFPPLTVVQRSMIYIYLWISLKNNRLRREKSR